MTGRGAFATAVSLALAGSVAAQPAPDGPARLKAARAEAAAAQVRADRLAAAAAGERDAARRAAADERALAGRVTAAEAALEAARARAAVVDALLARQRTRLDVAQAPAARLLGALSSLARRPALAAVAQPGSIDDLVHLRAVLGTALPVVRRRTEGLRVEVAQARRLADAARASAAALRQGRATLEGERTRLARLEADHRDRAGALGRGALSESDRALALGERARDLVDRMEEQGAAEAVAASLSGLPEPIMRPLSPEARLPVVPRGVYRLPVRGRLVTGFGEVSANGVRSRGLTLAVRPGAVVVAPAGGVVRYAARFREYGTIVIVEHGGGWFSLITGLGEARVAPGQAVAAGAAIGVAGAGDEPEVTVELRRQGRPIDAAALIG